jgi:hypothetical protein
MRAAPLTARQEPRIVAMADDEYASSNRKPPLSAVKKAAAP